MQKKLKWRRDVYHIQNSFLKIKRPDRIVVKYEDVETKNS